MKIEYKKLLNKLTCAEFSADWILLHMQESQRLLKLCKYNRKEKREFIQDIIGRLKESERQAQYQINALPKIRNEFENILLVLDKNEENQ